jgi:hypothetical protein
VAHKQHTLLFRYNDELRQALMAIKERDGVPLHEQVRRAVLMWIDARGTTPALAPRRAALASRAARLFDEVDAVNALSKDQTD